LKPLDSTHLVYIQRKQGNLGLGVERMEQAHRMLAEMGLAKGDLERLR